jgi:hypothetical protein
MPLYGVGPSISILPGSTGVLMGQKAIVGTPFTEQTAEALPANGYSRPVVIQGRPSGHPVTQRQGVLRLFPTAGSPPETTTLVLQLSIDDNPANYITVATFDTFGASNVQYTLQADGTSGDEASAILSCFRFVRIGNTGANPVNVFADFTSN